jgi:hypothetical protein
VPGPTADGPLGLPGLWLHEVQFAVGEFVCVFVILRRNGFFPGY